MELVLAGLASKARKTVVGSVDDTVTDRALLNTFKFLVKIALPYLNCFSQGSILPHKSKANYTYMYLVVQLFRVRISQQIMPKLKEDK